MRISYILMKKINCFVFRFLLPTPSAKDSDISQLNASVLSSSSMLQPCSQCDDSTMGSFDGCTGSPDNTDECFVNVIEKLPTSVSII